MGGTWVQRELGRGNEQATDFGFLSCYSTSYYLRYMPLVGSSDKKFRRCMMLLKSCSDSLARGARSLAGPVPAAWGPRVATPLFPTLASCSRFVGSGELVPLASLTNKRGRERRTGVFLGSNNDPLNDAKFELERKERRQSLDTCTDIVDVFALVPLYRPTVAYCLVLYNTSPSTTGPRPESG